jgi:UV excision repair protein RAD23
MLYTDASMNLFAAAQQHAQQQQQQQQQEQNQNLNASLANFRNTPHFQQIRQLVQTNPALLQPLLQSIGQSNPELIRAINADPNAFLQAFLEGAEGEEGGMGPETTTIQVTPEERDAIDRVRKYKLINNESNFVLVGCTRI